MTVFIVNEVSIASVRAIGEIYCIRTVDEAQHRRRGDPLRVEGVSPLSYKM